MKGGRRGYTASLSAIRVGFLGGWKGWLIVLMIGIGLFLHLYTRHIIEQLRSEARAMVEFYAHMYATVVETDNSDDLNFIFDQIIQRTNFPLIQTDPDLNPLSWKGLDIDPVDPSDEDVRRIREMVMRLERDIDPIPIRYEETLLGYLFYSDSRLIIQLQWLPYIEIGIVGIFILAGFLSYAHMKRSEQRNIWVGMAKETAHQLGTPLSSLMGWLEVIRYGGDMKKEYLVSEMEKDLTRLRQVTQRFSQIGSKPNLKEGDLKAILAEGIEYIRRRAPRMGRKVTINESYDNAPLLKINADLFQWVLENIMKNALDALNRDEGVLNVRLLHPEGSLWVAIEIEDNGKGMDSRQMKRIFHPGFSTKKRGWGLGLTLAKRIVEEYHGGKLYVKESRPGQGTVMRIELKGESRIRG